MELQHLYRTPGLPEGQRRTLLDTARRLIGPEVEAVDTEHCFNIALARPLPAADHEVLRWLLAETFEPGNCRPSSFLEEAAGPILEVGPRMSFTTAWSTNAVAVCHACGLADVLRIERSRRYQLRSSRRITEGQLAAFLASVHDRMTECRYPEPLRSLRRRGRAAAGVRGAAARRRAGGARAHQPRAGPRLRRLGPRLLHRALRPPARSQPDQRRVLRHRPVEQRALAPLVLQGPARHRRRRGPRPPHRHGPADPRRQPEQQRHRLPRQLERDPRPPGAGPAPGLARRARAAAAARDRRAPPVHRRDPQLPVRGRTLPGRRDRHRRAHPRHPRHRAGLAVSPPAPPPTASATCASRATSCRGRTRTSPTPPTWPRPSRSRSRPPTAPRTTATSSASR